MANATPAQGERGFIFVRLQYYNNKRTKLSIDINVYSTKYTKIIGVIF